MLSRSKVSLGIVDLFCYVFIDIKHSIYQSESTYIEMGLKVNLCDCMDFTHSPNG